MNLTKVMCVVRREYVESVRKRSFLFGLVATPLMMSAMIVLPLFSEGILANEVLRVGVLDRSGGNFGARLVESAEAPLELELIPTPTTDSALASRVEAGNLTGWLELPTDFAQSGEFTYRSESITNFTVLENLQVRVGRVLARERAAGFGLDSDAADRLLEGAELRTIRIGKAGESEVDFMQVYMHAVLLVMTLFFALIPTGHILMRSVIEEKSNRVIEVLLSSVTPLELMVGKIVGLGAVGLTLLGTWAAVGAFLSLRLGRTLPISAEEIGVFMLYFVPGYFLFAALLGSIGAICSSERDAQPFLTPISLLLILPVMMGVVLAQAPDHWLVRVLSFFPPLTPSLMLFRYAIKQPPAWEIAATWSTLVLATAAMFWMSSRVFRVGILMTGKRPTLPEIARWIRVG